MSLLGNLSEAGLKLKILFFYDLDLNRLKRNARILTD